MLLLEGKAHVYVFGSPGCKKWDTCAPQAVLEAAGGVLTDIQGNLIPYQASAPHRYAEVNLSSLLTKVYSNLVILVYSDFFCVNR